MVNSSLLYNEYPFTSAAVKRLGQFFDLYCEISFTMNWKYEQVIYRKIPIISPGVIFVQKAFLLDLFWAGNLFSDRLIIGKNFAFQNGLGLTIKTA